MKRYVWLVLVLLFTGLAAAPTVARVPPELLQAEPARFFQDLARAVAENNRAALNPWLAPGLMDQIEQRAGSSLAGLRSLKAVQSAEVIRTDVRERETVYNVRIRHEAGESHWRVAIAANSQLITRIDFSGSSASMQRAAPPRASAPETEGAPRPRTMPTQRSIRIDDAPVVAAPAPPRPAPTIDAVPNARSVGPASGGAASSLREARLVEFLFATTRAREAGEKVSFGSGRSADLAFGAAQVRIPEDHKSGKIELPTSISIFGLTFYREEEDERQHFIVKKLAVLSQDQWTESVRSRGAKDALVFVHGYKTSFEQALLRNAQIVWDLDYKGVSVLFSWASGGGLLDYEYDRNSALEAKFRFVEMLRVLARQGIENIHVLAHSMGNFVVLDALATEWRTSDPVRIAQLIMAAPDVDKHHFLQTAPQVRKIAKGMTLYASQFDKALAASASAAREVRAGDVPDGVPIVLPEMESIDVSALGEELFGLNHSTFAERRELIEDIKALLETGGRAPRAWADRLSAVSASPPPLQFWRYAPR